MNDYDKAGRYLVKREPAGFLRWLLTQPALTFQGWIDARRVALPDQKDLTNDLVAAVQAGVTLEAVCLELEVQARSDALTRQLAYLARIWTEPADQQSVNVSCVCGAILDLTGRSPAHELILRSTIVPDCRLELVVLRRSLANEDAAKLLASVAVGETSPWVLGWLPLMRGGGKSDIIASWRSLVERDLPDERDRGELGSIAVTFATLAKNQAAWELGLKGWNMETSPYLDRYRDQGRVEGRLEGRIEGEREALLRLGRQKFRKAPTRKQQKLLEGINDLAEIEALLGRVLEVDSWSELLRTE